MLGPRRRGRPVRSLSPSPPPPPALPPQPALWEDTDRDGLSNAEEILYRSERNRPDTDRDGFLDGHEVVNLYNPSGIAPERIEDAGLARRFVNELAELKFAYEALIPTAWGTTPGAEGPRVISVSDQNNNRIFEIGVIENIEGIPLSQWYRSQAPGAPGFPDATPWLSNKFGLPGLMAPDRTKAYFAGQGGVIYTVAYGEGARDSQTMAQYKTTFEMMLNSFKIR